MAECEPSLRESKRQATRAAIEDQATALAEKHGVNNITVEDICSAVGISKRTFFNYVDSKETAVLGAPPRVPSEEEKAEFLSAEHSNILGSLVRLTFELAVTVRFVAPEQRATILRRRRHIRQQDPNLAFQQQAGMHVVSQALTELVTEYLQLYPGRQKLEASPKHEAITLVSITLGTIQLGHYIWLEQNDGSDTALENCCLAALSELKTIFKDFPDDYQSF
ncbi:TetR/AcrR family transcriptional regulator [Corynebacterium poyangense]|nr:TetR/AcrR family transcriptional regulator [Corynebacterium poyangense]